MSKKSQVAILSVGSNTLLIAMKIVVGLLSGSVSIISEAIHSFMDLVAAVIAFFSVKYSDDPPDDQHPYGHGKIENVSGVVEALLIFVAAIWIIYEAVKKLTHPSVIEQLGWATAVMIISALVNWLVAKRLYKVARETDSVALEADALHLQTDVYTSLGVAAGLVLIKITGLHLFDPIVAIVVALIIIQKSYELLVDAFKPLIDHQLTKDEVDIISSSLKEKNYTFHNLKTRKSGSYRFAELHLELDENMSLKDVHRTCDRCV